MLFPTNFRTQTELFVRVRSSRSEVFLVKGVLKICSKFAGELSCRIVIYFIEITLQHGCSPVKLLHIFRTPFIKNTSGWLLFQCVYEVHSLLVTRVYDNNCWNTRNKLLPVRSKRCKEKKGKNKKRQLQHFLRYT